MPRCRWPGCAHRRIMHRLTRSVVDRAPEPPSCPGPPVDPDNPACLGIAHTLLDQPDKALLLVRCPTTRATTPPPLLFSFQRLLHCDLHSPMELRRSLESASSRRGQINLSFPDGPQAAGERCGRCPSRRSSVSTSKE